MSIIVAINPKVISLTIKAITPPRITRKNAPPFPGFKEMRMIPAKIDKQMMTTLITYKTRTSDLNLVASLLIENASLLELALESLKRSLISLIFT